jgi:phosphatidate cytidylyltransferase
VKDPTKRTQRLIARVATSLCLIAGCAACLLADALDWAPLGVLTLANVALILGLIEFHRLARACGAKPFAGLSLAGGLLVLNWPWLADAAALSLHSRWRLMDLALLLGGPGGGLLLLVIAVLVAHWLARGRSDTAFHDATATLFGVVYLALPLAAFSVLVWSPDQEAAIWKSVVLLVATAKAGDAAACGIGNLAGRHKLAPKTSPNKTIEGAIAGLAGSVLICVALGSWLLRMRPMPLVVLGVIVGVFGQLGDLTESALKRSAGVKDSGSLLPGMGGVLDLLDSLLLSLPAGAFTIRLIEALL